MTEHTTSARAGTEALALAAAALPALGGGGLVVAAEAPPSAPGTVAGDAAGAAAVVLALAEGGRVATVEATASYAAEEPGLRFTPRGAAGVHDIEVAGYAQAALLGAVDGAVRQLVDRLGRHAGDYDHVVVGVADERLASRAAGRWASPSSGGGRAGRSRGSATAPPPARSSGWAWPWTRPPTATPSCSSATAAARPATPSACGRDATPGRGS